MRYGYGAHEAARLCRLYSCRFALGPTALGLVEDREQIDIIAELGVLMLLFVIGMELSIRLFLRLWKFVLLATSFQILAAGGITLLLSNVFDWSLGMAVLLGFVVALSSTAIGIKMLEETGELKTRTGLLCIWDPDCPGFGVHVPMLLVLGVISVGEADYRGLLVLLGSVLMLGWLMWYLAKGGRIQIPFLKNIVKNMDLTPLGALAFLFWCGSGLRRAWSVASIWRFPRGPGAGQ